MRSNVLMQPSVTRNPDELIKAIGRYRRRQLAWTWGPLVLGFAVLIAFCVFLLSDAGQNFMVWMDSR